MRRLYNAVCDYLEASADDLRTPEPPPQREGSTAETERTTTQRGTPEMHGEYRGTELEDDNGEYRIGFSNRHTRT